jgi:lysophospholipase L1-like esterase
MRPLVLLAVVLLAAPAYGNTATAPVPRDAAWLKRHEAFKSEAARGGIDVLFLGDSITDGWRTVGRRVWDKQFVPLRAANFGIDGDRTQHVLWRLVHGEVDGISPRVIVLLIGTNNTGRERQTGVPRNTTGEAIAGVISVVRTLREQLPSSKILLLGLFPRGEKDSPQREQVAEINRAISALADNKQVHFLDLGARFLAPDGSIPSALMPDLLHPSEIGYQVWADALAEPLRKLLQG